MNVRFLTLAQQEVNEAFIWFDERTVETYNRDFNLFGSRLEW